LRFLSAATLRENSDCSGLLFCNAPCNAAKTLQFLAAAELQHQVELGHAHKE
jgi:hypothetical protein